MAQILTRARSGAAMRSSVRAGKVMILGRDRVAYAGLLGEPTVRNFGCLTVYSALASPLKVLAQGGSFQAAGMAVVPPYVPHRVSTRDRMIGVLMIEPESVDPDGLPGWLAGAQAREVTDPVAARVRDSFLGLVRGDYGRDLTGVDTDQLFLGRTFEPRALDPRIAAIVGRICGSPHGQLSAEESALLTELSFSRFLHLFRAEVGATFRGFRAWKRARSFLRYANGTASLTDLALEIGYPDSTHFSHTIRQVYGLRPKDIFAGSRDLSIVRQDVERLAPPMGAPAAAR
ncbi:helix-turn-helix domain-containing protein [Quisquiliibacterium transsilvanicum]|uniref:AraC-like DNA-binding protein n=1 Tax=Quisquiliibacterium transsilvanicum TaxID=1549638 RepID=A0A7W8M8J7_9BURK|nr:AraC family transcriptional regulator [Quisquiliibacterium transsilvanicum]MBB5271722.1 AraC-like DNA-binding protein [Quisquiliibacterium transsilvanicum]